MAQFRTTADVLDLALANAGEVTNGNSSYETQLLNYLNKVHLTLISGGTIPILKDQTVEIDEVWPWSKARSPLILELQPKYTTGTVAFIQGSEAGTFSAAPAASLKGYHITVQGKDEWFKIVSHTAGATAFEIDGAYSDTTESGLNFTAVKLDYDLIPSYIVIDETNNKLEFQETAGTTLTATLTSGTYTPSDLCTEIKTQMEATGGTPVYTVTYSTVTRKFTIASDRGGSSVFVLVGTGSNSLFSAHKTLGFDDENTTNAASVTSTYVLGGISRLVEPFRIHKNLGIGIFGLDGETFQRDYPFATIREIQPDRFAVIKEKEDGTLTVRFNGYPIEKTRIEIEYVPIPRDLRDNSYSIPLVPRKHIDVLESAATFFLMLNKSDDRVQVYANLLYGKLKSMIAQHRGSLMRTGENFGQIVPRQDQVPGRVRRFYYGYNW